MKRINYILLILISTVFSSCEKETLGVLMDEKDKNYNNIYVNPADTAGIVVPEGYSMVIMGESQTGTRAVNGASDRISHLQYLLYERQDDGIYKLYNKMVVFNSAGSKNWPYDAQIEILPKGKSWKVVFLGNMSKSLFGAYQTEEVLTGVDDNANYDDARIHLPQVEFAAQTMFHLAENDFTTHNGDATVEVPITLKRIVSRHDIYQEGSNDMVTYYTETLKDKLYNDIFIGNESVFRYQLKETVLKEIIWPFTCAGLFAITEPENYRTTYKAIDWYLNNSDLYAEDYKITWQKLAKEEQAFTFLKNDDYLNNYFLNFAEYLYEAFVEGNDPDAMENALTQVCTENENQFMDNVQNKISTYFKANYKTGVLAPWSGHAIIKRNEVPSVVKLSLDVVEHDKPGQKFYQGNTRTNGRKYFSIVTLPEKDETNRLNMEEILGTPYFNGGGVDQLPTTTNNTTVISNSPLNGGPFLPNMKYDCIQKVTTATLIDKTLWTPYEKNWHKMELNYENIMSYLFLKDDGKGTITMGSSNHIKELCKEQQYVAAGNFYASTNRLTNALSIILKSIYFRLETDTSKVFPFTFKSPVFQDNINAVVVWEEATPKEQ